LLEGKTVNLRVVEKADLALGIEWINNPEYFGQYQPFSQQSREELDRQYDRLTPEEKWFFMEKKDGTKIGSISYGPVGKAFEIGYDVISAERGRRYGTEAVGIIVDFLFLSKETMHVQAHADPRNVASQRVLERNGFQKEGTIRKFMFVRGEWRDMILFSILREEWKEPKILTKTEKK
jgi:RimJ/RimL family protein N-acetyltransferase